MEKCERDKARIALAKEAFFGERNILCGKMNLGLKKRLAKCFVWSVFLYGAETWTMREREKPRLEAFEMWLWRRMEMIKLADKVRNKEVLRQRFSSDCANNNTVDVRKCNGIKCCVGGSVQQDVGVVGSNNSNNNASGSSGGRGNSISRWFRELRGKNNIPNANNHYTSTVTCNHQSKRSPAVKLSRAHSALVTTTREQCQRRHQHEQAAENFQQANDKPESTNRRYSFNDHKIPANREKLIANLRFSRNDDNVPEGRSRRKYSFGGGKKSRNSACRSVSFGKECGGMIHEKSSPVAVTDKILSRTLSSSFSSSDAKHKSKRTSVAGFAVSSELRTVMEKCENFSTEMFESRSLDEEARSRGKIYLPHADSVDSIFSNERPPSPPERDVSLKNHTIDNEFMQYNHSYQDSSYQSQDGDYAECYLEEGRTLLTKAELEQYTKTYEESLIRPSHQKQPSYAQSEGYHSYVSSNDSAIITPIIDRLRRENDQNVPTVETAAGRESSASASSGSSSDTLKWHGSLSDISVASSYRSNAQLIAHSARVQTPQRHHSESVLYLGNGSGTSSSSSSQSSCWQTKGEKSNQLNNCHLRKLYPVNTYSVQPELVPVATRGTATVTTVAASNDSPTASSSLTVAERILELEKKQQQRQQPPPPPPPLSMRYTYYDPDKKHKVTDRSLKVIQKKALLSYYERHHSAWRSEPQLSPVPSPPQLSSRPRLPTPTSQSDSSEEGQDVIAKENIRKEDSVNLPPKSHACNKPEPLVRSQYSSSCGSLVTAETCPVIVGSSISVDDWVPELPPKKAHLRSPFTPQRISSPDLPPPSPPPIVDDEVFISDEPLPPPPPEIISSVNSDSCERLYQEPNSNLVLDKYSDSFKVPAQPLPVNRNKVPKNTPTDSAISAAKPNCDTSSNDIIKNRHLSKNPSSNNENVVVLNGNKKGKANVSKVLPEYCQKINNYKKQDEKLKATDSPNSSNLSPKKSGNSNLGRNHSFDSLNHRIPYSKYDAELNNLTENHALAKFTDNSTNYQALKESFLRSAIAWKDRVITSNEKSTDFAYKKSAFINGYERQSLRYPSSRRISSQDCKPRSYEGPQQCTVQYNKFIKNNYSKYFVHNTAVQSNSVPTIEKYTRSDSSSPSRSNHPSAVASLRYSEGFPSKLEPRCPPTNYQLSQSSYRREPREREKGVPNFEGSYKRTMSPSNVSSNHYHHYNHHHSSTNNILMHGNHHHDAKDIENIEPVLSSEEHINYNSSDSSICHSNDEDNNRNGNNRYLETSSASQPLFGKLVNRPMNSNSDIIQRLPEYSQTLPRNYVVLPTTVATTVSSITMEGKRGLRTPRTQSDPSTMPSIKESVLLPQSSSSLSLQKSESTLSTSIPRSQSDLSNVGSVESGYSSLSLNVPSPSTSPTRLSSDRSTDNFVTEKIIHRDNNWSCVQTQCDIEVFPTMKGCSGEITKPIQRSEAILRIGATTSDAASQTENLNCSGSQTEANQSMHPKYSRDSSTSPMLRQKLQEEIDCEELSRDLISHLSPNDKLHGILTSKPDAKTSMDYVSDLFRTNVIPRSCNQVALTHDSAVSSIVTTVNQTGDTRFQESCSVLRTCCATNVPPPKLQSSSDVNNQFSSQSLSNLQRKKEELASRLDRKLNVLREEQITIMEECRINDTLGDVVSKRVGAVASSHETAKLKLHIQEIGHITSLLLGLSGRLARVENCLLELSEDNTEKKMLESKRDKLASQLEEAKALKENIDRRGNSVSFMLQRYFTDEELSDYDHFVKMKSKLLIDSREISDKIQLGEEQLNALRETLHSDTS